MPTDQGRADNDRLLLLAFSWAASPEAYRGTAEWEKTESALTAARAEERRKAGEALLIAQHDPLGPGGHTDRCAWMSGRSCNCGQVERYQQARAYLDACAAEAGKETT